MKWERCRLRHNTQHDDIKDNDTQKRSGVTSLPNSQSIVMLNAIILSALTLGVVMLNFIMLNVVMLGVAMLNITMLSVIILSVTTPPTPTPYTLAKLFVESAKNVSVTHLWTSVVRRFDRRRRRYRRRRRRRAVRAGAMRPAPVPGSHRRRSCRAPAFRSRNGPRMRPLPRLRVDQRLLAQQEVVHGHRGPVESGTTPVFLRCWLTGPSGLN